jgi:predicted Zn-dependent peptidase
MCSTLDAGYMPPDLGSAVAALNAEHPYVATALRKLASAMPLVAGTNADYGELAATVQLLGQVSQEASRIRLDVATVRQQLTAHARPDVTLVHMMPGLRTYPYVASARAKMPLRREDRAKFIVSSQIMVGGMGSVYTHDLRQRGVSYRPAGGARLGWQQAPVIMLHATFDASQARQGSELTTKQLSGWCNGDPRIFTHENVRLAKKNLVEQLYLTRMDYATIEYGLLADMYPDRYSTDEVAAAVQAVTAESLVSTMQAYFGPGAAVRESWVSLDDRVLM